MKKFLLSACVAMTFLAYSLYQRAVSDSASQGLSSTNPVASPPPSATQEAVPTPSPTVMPTPTPTKQTVVHNTPVPTPVPTQPLTPSPTPRSGYKDGVYTGVVADAYYGNIQVQASIRNGRITTIQFLQYPNDRGTSIEINRYADPQLAQEAIQAQTANVDIISGATDSSQAFVASLQSALQQAKG